ncbi:MAG: hypothetical protein JXA42_05615 [Anaerolineales bacterium]|nr:hypothetical protein [Anaerolineales bacterium]
MKQKFLILIVALLITSLACNVMGGKDESEQAESQAPVQETTGSDEEQASDESSQEAATTEEEEQVVEQDEAQSSGDAEQEQTGGTDSEEQDTSEAGSEAAEDESEQNEIGLEAIDSYRSHQTWQAELADGSLEQVIIESEVVREPNGFHSTIQTIKGDTVEILETIRIGDTQWTRINDEWMKTQIDELDFEDNQSTYFLFDYEVFLESGMFSKEGKEKINGIQTRHFRATSLEDASNEMDMAWLYAMMSSYSITENVTDLENVSDEYWLADEKDLPAFVVRHVQEARGLDADGQVVVYTDIFEVFDLNEPFTIEPPEDVLAGWPPQDIPQCSDGTVDTSTGFGEGGMMLLTCPGDLDAVAGFYQDALDAAGWTQAESSKPMDTMLMDVWTKDGRTMNLLIQQEGGSCTVTITVEGS